MLLRLMLWWLSSISDLVWFVCLGSPPAGSHGQCYKPLARSFKFLVSLLLRLVFSAYLLLIRRPLRLDHNKDLKIRFSYSLVSINFSESNKHFGYIHPVEKRLVVFYAAKNRSLCQSSLLTVSKSRVRKQREIFRIRTSKQWRQMLIPIFLLEPGYLHS